MNMGINYLVSTSSLHTNLPRVLLVSMSLCCYVMQAQNWMVILGNVQWSWSLSKANERMGLAPNLQYMRINTKSSNFS